jgi:hypothetical protein
VRGRSGEDRGRLGKILEGNKNAWEKYRKIRDGRSRVDDTAKYISFKGHSGEIGQGVGKIQGKWEEIQGYRGEEQRYLEEIQENPVHGDL